MRPALLASLLALAGCASTGEPRAALVVEGNANTVTVNWAPASRGAALVAADAHCAKHGKTARQVSAVDFFVTYDCVKG